jgi:hypothetical protein
MKKLNENKHKLLLSQQLSKLSNDLGTGDFNLRGLKSTSNNKNKNTINNKNERQKFKKPRSRTVNTSALINKAPITFNIVLDQLCKPFGYKTDPAIKEVIKFHDEMIKNHSVVEGTARYNSIRLYSIMLLEGQNPDPLDRVAVGRKDR